MLKNASLICGLLFVASCNFVNRKSSNEIAIDLCANYLLNNINEDGSFNTGKHINQSISFEQRYNLKQHAGAMSALCNYYHYKKHDNKTVLQLNKASAYLSKIFLDTVPSYPGLLAIWNSHKKKPDEACVGDAAMALSAFCLEQGVNPYAPSPTKLSKLAGFILSMQMEDGSFFDLMNKEGERFHPEKRNLMNQSRAILALLDIYNLTKEERFLIAANKATSHLLNQYQTLRLNEYDFWFLLATEKLLNLNSKLTDQDLITALVDYRKAACKRILEQQEMSEKESIFYGGFSKKGLINQSTVKIIGLYACIDKQNIDTELERALKEANNFLLTAQIKEGPHKGTFTKAISELPGEGVLFNEKAGRIRLDYNYHALNAMIQHHKLFKN